MRIICGTDFTENAARGQTTLRYLLLGSTAERLLRELPCSVLTVRPTDAENVPPIP